MNANTPRILLASLFVSALTPGLAWADAAAEEFYQPRADIKDDVLRRVIGIVNIGAGPEPRGELPIYEPRPDDTFEMVGSMPLERMRAISGYDYGFDSVRRFPVLEKRGDHLLTIIDVRSGERAWIREHEWRGPEDYVIYHDLETAFVGGAVDVRALARSGRAELYRAPSPDTRGAATEDVEPLLDDLRVLRLKGDFAQVGTYRGPDEEPDPVGWIRIRDAQGLLVAWPVVTDDC